MEKLDKKEKLNRIINLLNGSLSFEVMKPPKAYVIFFNGTFYKIEDLELNEDEFKKWQKDNIRPTDSILIFKEQLSRVSPGRLKETDSNFFLNCLQNTSTDSLSILEDKFVGFPIRNECQPRIGLSVNKKCLGVHLSIFLI